MAKERFNFLRSRLTRWALRRQGPDTLPLTLKSRRLYILPTRAGLAFGGLLVVAFVAGMNYGSGLAMLLSFWLCGFFITALLQTHRSLAGARIVEARAEPAFCGAPVTLRLRLNATVPGESLRATDPSRRQWFSGSSGSDRGNETHLSLMLPTARRGTWRAPPLQLETHAPFGLFRCWTWLQLDASTDVYPHPAGEQAVPASPGDDAGHQQLTAGLEELTWLRSFREGDSPRQVAWKAYARGMPLLVREYRDTAGATRTLDFDSLAPLPTEQRLSQLCRWVLDTTERGEFFTLVLPRQNPAAGTGAAHLQHCLIALSRYGEARAT
jgi:uncharacterized protein (DUF58 family)